MKRESHYFFAHKKLRQLALSEPSTIYNIMRSPRATDFLADIYSDLQAQYNDEVQIVVSSKHFNVAVRRLGQRPLILITLPKTIIAPEAKYVGILLPADLENHRPEDYHKIGYYTLERSDNSADPEFMLGEWSGDESHQNFGKAKNARIDAFEKWIEQKAD